MWSEELKYLSISFSPSSQVVCRLGEHLWRRCRKANIRIRIAASLSLHGLTRQDTVQARADLNQAL